MLPTQRAGDGHVPATDGLLEPIASVVVGAVQTAAFWLAVALPLLYVPVLAGVVTRLPAVAALVAALVATNALALVVGHGHRRDDSGERRPERTSQG